MKSMKLFLLVLIVSASFLQCSDDEPSAKDKKIKLLTSDVWVTESVNNSTDGDLTFQYTGFSIAFVKSADEGFQGDYYLSGGGHAFPELTGKWKFNKDLKKLILQNGREMEITLNTTSLTLAFHVAPTGGRVKGLSGDFTFKLKKQN